MQYADIKYSRKLLGLFSDVHYLTTDDLLGKLPTEIEIYRFKEGYEVYSVDTGFEASKDKSLPNALAKMLIYLKDNGLLKDKCT